MFIHVEMCINTTSHLHIKHPNWPQLLLQKGSKKRAWNILLPNSQIFDDSIWRLISSLFFFFFFVLNPLPRKEKKRKERKIKISLNITKVPFLLVHFLSCYTGFLDGSEGKESACNAGDTADGFRPLDTTDPLEEKMDTHSSILAWKLSWPEKPCGIQSMGLQKSQTRLSIHTGYLSLPWPSRTLLHSFFSLAW